MSGPHALTRHPLYAGSIIIGIGLSIACVSIVVAALVLTYLAITLTAAIRTEEAHFTEKFGRAYPDYRPDELPPLRAGSVSRVRWTTANFGRFFGLLLAIVLLAIKAFFAAV